MRYHGRINYVKCTEWGLNPTQGLLFDLLNEATSWAKEIIIGDQVYYWVSRNKVLEELPIVFGSADTVYRNLKALAKKGLIDYRKEGKKDLVRLTAKGKSWNAKIISEKNPSTEIDSSELGNKSEKDSPNSDLNPTYKDTSLNKGTNNNIYAFDAFWDLYDYKVDKDRAKAQWAKLTDEEKRLAIEHAPLYVKSKPDKQFRKYPTTYLNYKGWENEVVIPKQNTQGNTHENNQPNNQKPTRETKAQFEQRLQREFNDMRANRV